MFDSQLYLTTAFVLKTKFLPATDFTGARIQVQSKSLKRTITESGSWRKSVWPYPYDTNDAHEHAAQSHSNKFFDGQKVIFVDTMFNNDDKPTGDVYLICNKGE